MKFDMIAGPIALVAIWAIGMGYGWSLIPPAARALRPIFGAF